MKNDSIPSIPSSTEITWRHPKTAYLREHTESGKMEVRTTTEMQQKQKKKEEKINNTFVQQP